jgi:hypothetical protein
MLIESEEFLHCGVEGGGHRPAPSFCFPLVLSLFSAYAPRSIIAVVISVALLPNKLIS